jgi:hypothetical protein
MDFDDEMDFSDGRESFDYDGESYGEDTPGEPDFRAVVQRSGVVPAVYWHDGMHTTGPVYTLIAGRERAGVAIADLSVVRADDGAAIEVIVELHCGGDDHHKAALVSWASMVGYRRIWFDREVVELNPAADGLVETRCSGCGGRFIDGRSQDFWQHVRCVGLFPTMCALCGSDLPQWTPVARRRSAMSNRKVRRRVGGTPVSGRGPRS